MPGGGELFSGDFGEESGRGPDPDSGHADQDGLKRVSIDEFLHFDGDLVALSAQCGELFGEAGQYRGGRIRAHDDYCLLAEGLHDFGGETTTHPGCSLDQSVLEPDRAGGSHRRWRRVLLQQVQHRRVVQVRAQNPLQCWVDLREEAADTVAGRDNLPDDVVVEPAQHRQFSDLFIGQLNGPQRVRKRASRLGDDGRITSISLRLTWVQIGDATHRQARQIANEDVLRLSDRNRQRTDRRGLIDDEEDLTVLFQLPDNVSKLGLIVGQSLVEEQVA